MIIVMIASFHIFFHLCFAIILHKYSLLPQFYTLKKIIRSREDTESAKLAPAPPTIQHGAWLVTGVHQH